MQRSFNYRSNMLYVERQDKQIKLITLVLTRKLFYYANFPNRNIAIKLQNRN